MVTTNQLQLKESIIELLAQTNLVENRLVQNTLTQPLEEIAEGIEKLIVVNMNLEKEITNDAEALFYVRLLRAKYEEILDIIDLKQAN